MLFKKKGKLRSEFNQKLFTQLEIAKKEWMRQKNLIEKSIEPSDDILNELKVAETKYFFLLREAKRRKVFL
ncbi:YaaL family protein [Fredinandcohnia sp. QZ13]|uniref:YaaL family protein n=1 Tax=Fredinandcohnia sp. QZ13 TaxID=3073144 RepID=UPI00285356E1|nr:YaaL family protein [Fredinandcohnia sp. QZ13]MDR4888538.1 YaaL family protein [Fredinandcohnia sp. QZ13]